MPEGQISPYVGAGLNLTLFYNEDTPGDVVTGISYSTSVGPAVQAGVDVKVGTNWGINLDVKKAWINTDLDIDTVIGAVTADVDLNPWIFGAGFRYYFSY